MRYSTLQYYFEEGFGNVIKNKLMSVASIITVASSILIISLTYCIAANLDYILEQFENSIGVTVILNGNVADEDVNAIGAEIGAIPNVSTVKYVSPEEALKSVEAEWGKEALEGLGEDNPLSKSFSITVSDIAYQKKVVYDLEQIEGVATVKHAAGEIETLMWINEKLRVGSLVFIFLLSVMAVIIITNSIRLSVFSRKNEIAIMKLVGATDWFIRWPFIIEGILLGLLGTIIPMALTWAVYNNLAEGITASDFLSTFLTGFIKIRSASEIMRTLLPFSLCFGIFLGAIGSILSVRKHLKV